MSRQVQPVPIAPHPLGEAGAALWAAVLADHPDLTVAQLALLEVAATATDRQAQARELIDREGMVLSGGRYGPRPHPAVAVERNAALIVVRSMKALALPIVETPADLAAQLGYTDDDDDAEPRARARGLGY